VAEKNEMAKNRDVIYVGIRGTVLALDRGSGAEIWRAALKGWEFVNIALDRDVVLATTQGQLYCLDSTTGKTLWKNELKGLGRGLMTVATANSPLGSVAPSVAQKQIADAAAGTAAAAGSS